jgi:hypothetical protein
MTAFGMVDMVVLASIIWVSFCIGFVIGRKL